ncbi:hypothetical protein [Pseudomonas phage 98PfluR60PP]|uniref:Uncharacterized protein n=1 Tax=Pseudomonas phage 98PfluR60PP TaxID=2163965 RepID=A0A2S1PFY9_9CAUD|nr:hypothetical protein PP760_gp03 [Pseudomonas phage 98PfluR60PP]AWH15435.1 hypothetical protein [Pseudomonas phage 98PfluR60PP]
MLIVVFSIGFAAGRYTPNSDILNECVTKGETTLKGTRIACKPVATTVGTEEVEIKQ